MKGKNVFGLLNFVLLVFLTLVCSSLVLGEIVLEKSDYEMGDQVTFEILSDVDGVVEIVHESRVFRLLGASSGAHSFYPELPGEYIIKFIDDSSKSISKSFFVKDLDSGEFIKRDEFDKNSFLVVTNKARYSLGEEVLISFDSDDSISEVLIVIDDREYSFIGSPNFPISFFPSNVGIHEVVLKSVDGVEYKTTFDVILKKQNSNYSPRIPSHVSKSVPVRVVNSKGVNQNFEVDVFESVEHKSFSATSHISSGNLSEDKFYDMKISSRASNVKMSVKGFKFEEGLGVGLEDLRNRDVNGMRNSKILSISANIYFKEAVISSVAVGRELLRCGSWDFNEQSCTSEWEKVKDLVPGTEYDVLIESGEVAYAETGVASINSLKSIYRPKEVAELVVVVLDRDGYLVPNASLEVNVTSPLNETYIYSTDDEIVDLGKGVYFVNHSTSVEGDYVLSVHAKGRNVDDFMASYFVVSDDYEFDIVRSAPVTIDPYQGPFSSSINITSFIDVDNFSFTETLPKGFTIFDDGGADVFEDDDFIYLTWHNLDNNSVVEYEFNSPFIIPYLWSFKSFVSYDDLGDVAIFNEARPWYLAIDPINYYDPTSNILTQWSSGSGTSYVEISKGTRQPSIPNTATFISSERNAEEISEFGFPAVVEDGVEEITLWVYASTGRSSSFDFSLRQGAEVLCSTNVPGSSNSAWFSCSIINPIGDLSSLSVHFDEVQNVGGPTSTANVYAAYIEVDTGNPPPDVSLVSPDNLGIVESVPVSFDFVVSDETYSVVSCDLYTNVSGSWSVSSSLNSVDTNTLTSFDLSPSDGIYSWNVMCENTDDKSAFADNNRTVYVNAVAPLIENEALNESLIRQNRTVKFSVNITDSFGIDSAVINVTYPNSSMVQRDLLFDESNFYFDFTNTLDEGIYNVSWIWANDTLGRVSEKNTDLWFEVQVVPPTVFDLLAPLNATESRELQPVMSWEETITPDFDNYTLFISKTSDFSSVDFVYSTSSITNANYSLDYSLDANTMYYWKVIAYDVFGNFRESTNHFVYINDRRSPVVSLESPADNGFVTNSLVTFSYIPDDTNTIDYCELFTNQTGSWDVRETDFNVLKNELNEFSLSVPEGSTIWNVQCFDDAGNLGFDNNRTIISDTTGPIISLISPEDGVLIDDTNIVSFGAVAYDELSSVDYCELLVNGSVTETNSNVVDDEQFNFSTFLSNDYYEWRVRCFDDLGNSDITSSRFLTVESLDTDPPVISLLQPENKDFINSSSMFFSYYVQDATGIESCSLFIDGEFEQQSSDVVNFAENNFSVSGFFEDYFNWSVSCVDNSSESNVGYSATRFFTIDLTNPVVILNSPDDGVFLNFDDVDFVYTPSDDNLDSCYLFANFTGSFEEVAVNDNPLSDVQNVFSVGVPSGVFVWNVLCDDLSERRSFASENFSVGVDTEPPKYSDVVVSPSPPVDYVERFYYFNISWIDNFDVDTVIFEHNFSGSLVEEELFLNNDVYNFSIHNLSAGYYSYRWIANDSSGNVNETVVYDYFINKSDPMLDLSLDGLSGNITVDESSSVSIQGSVSLPSNGYLELFVNNDLVSSNSSSVSVDYFFDEPGSYNVTLAFNETDNYFFGKKTFFVFVDDITPPVITLSSPSDDTLLSSGTRTFSFSVNDSSSIDYCKLYINESLNQTLFDVEREVIQSFSVFVEPDSYSWRVECEDSFSNLGVSEIRTFNAVDDDDINVFVESEKAEYEDGAPAKIFVNTTDAFGNSLDTTFVNNIIRAETSVPWWNINWTNRKPLEIVETSTSNQEDLLVGLNISGFGGVQSCEDDLRIVRYSNFSFDVVPREIHYSGEDWCFVVFFANLSTNEVNNEFYAYYNNSEAINPNDDLDLTVSALFNAQEAGADEGTPQNIENLIGRDDATSATMTQGGGGGTHSAHGRAFINETFGPIQSVDIRYRYAVPDDGGTWSLRYSVDDGAEYIGLFSGTSGIIDQTTSSWQDITTRYSSLSWSELNRTRLQGHVTKTGGGTITLDVFWVELNVTHKRNPNVLGSVLGDEVLIASSSHEVGSCGCAEVSWSTLGEDLGLYSSVVLASADSYNDASSFTTFEVVPDMTPPNVSLISPSNGTKRGKGLVDFSYVPFDYNLDYCTLFIANQSSVLEPVVSEANLVNGDLNTFYDVFVDIGIYDWNVECFDSYDNSAFAPENFMLNVSAPDLVVESDDIWFVYDDLIEGAVVDVFANISNEGLSAVEEEFEVQFYLGDPLLGGELVGFEVVNGLDSLDVITLNASFSLSFGPNNVFVLVDPDNVVNETSTDNNVANNTLNVELYQYYFGSSSSDIVLGKDALSMFIEYSNLSGRGGTVFFADADASFSYNDLQALTRNVDGGLVSGDFSTLDSIMGTSHLNDSILNVWGGGSEVPIRTHTFDLPSGRVHDVPVVFSTEYDDFVTGILWDTSDDSGNERFDSSDAEAVVFVTEINPSSQGRFGIYDFEIRVPATLRTYSGETEKLSFYIEII